jgi:hypothetical protein
MSRFAERRIALAILLAFLLVLLNGLVLSRASAGEPPAPPTWATRAERAEARAAVLEALRDALEREVADEAARSTLAVELQRVCERESHCLPVGPHLNDGWAGQRFYERAVARGWLRPDTCIEHEWSADPWAWTAQGPWGIAAAYLLRYADDQNEDGEPDCISPHQLSDIELSATLTVRYTYGLHRNGYGSCIDRTRVWVGVGRFAKLPFAKRVASIARQCGNDTAVQYAKSQVF